MTEPNTPGAVPPGWPVPQQPAPEQRAPEQPAPPFGAAPGAAPAAPWDVPQQGYPAGYGPPPSGYPGYQMPPGNGYQMPPGYEVPPGYPAPPPPGYGPMPGYVPPGYYPPPGAYPPGYFPGAFVQPPVLVGDLPLASFLDRFLGYLIDAVIKGVVLGVPAYIVAYFLVFRDFFRQTTLGYPRPVPNLQWLFQKELLALAVIVPIYIIGSYIYDVLTMYSSGQTIGKRVMKTRIVRLVDGGPITLGIATRRWFIENVCGYIPGLVYVDCLWLLWDKPYQQCLHDKFARTAVVKVNQATAAATA